MFFGGPARAVPRVVFHEALKPKRACPRFSLGTMPRQREPETMSRLFLCAGAQNAEDLVSAYKRYVSIFVVLVSLEWSPVLPY